MTLPFLDKEAEREWVQRIERARESEDQRHRTKKAGIGVDFTGRGLASSTVCFGALRDEDLNHLRLLIRIAREELFTVVEGRNIKLSPDDVTAITAHLQHSFGEQGEHIQQEQRKIAKERGLPSLAGAQLQMMIDEAMHHEATLAVSIRASERRSKQNSERKKSLLKGTGSLMKLVLAAVLGVLGTLIVQWLTKGPK